MNAETTRTLALWSLLPTAPSGPTLERQGRLPGGRFGIFQTLASVGVALFLDLLCLVCLAGFKYLYK